MAGGIGSAPFISGWLRSPSQVYSNIDTMRGAGHSVWHSFEFGLPAFVISANGHNFSYTGGTNSNVLVGKKLFPTSASYALTGGNILTLNITYSAGGEGRFPFNSQWLQSPSQIYKAINEGSMSQVARTIWDAWYFPGVSHVTMQAANGIYSLSGKAASLLDGHNIKPVTGTYLSKGYASNAPALTRLSLFGSPIGAVWSSNANPYPAYMPTLGSTFALTGNAATLTYTAKLVAANGAYGYVGGPNTQLGPPTITLLAGQGQYFTDKTIFILNGQQGFYFTANGNNTAYYAHNIKPVSGAYTYTGNAATLNSGQTMISAQGTYAYTGVAAKLLYGHDLTVANGIYSYIGYSTILDAGYTIYPAKGTFAYSGVNQSLSHGRDLTAAYGTYTYTGYTDSDVRTFELSAFKGSYAFAAQFVALLDAHIFPVGAGAYTYIGGSAVTAASHIVNAAMGAYTYTGNSATFTVLNFYDISASTGTYTYTGRAAGVLNDHIINLASHPFVYSGKAATILHASLISPTHGIYSLTGQNSILLHGRDVRPVPGTYAESSIAANLYKHSILNSATRAFVYTGKAQALLKEHFLTAVRGIYTYTGVAQSLRHNHKVLPISGHYTYTGGINTTIFRYKELIAASRGFVYSNPSPVKLLHQRHPLVAAQGAYTYTGYTSSYGKNSVLHPVMGHYILNGIAASKLYDRNLSASLGTYTYTGIPVLPRPITDSTVFVATYYEVVS
jgi:hypothetical protein